MGIYDTLLNVGGDLATAYIGRKTAKDASNEMTSALSHAQGVSAAATTQARGDVMATAGPGLEDILSGYQGAISTLEEPGQAEYMSLALSGVLGPEAQQEAQQGFLESPGQQWLRDQQEQALIRNAGAIGGLGGGRVRSALQEEAFGRSATQQQQNLQNVMSMIGPETSRSTNIANLLSSGGTQLANFRSGIGSNLANLAVGGASQQIPLVVDAGRASAAGVLGQGSAVQQGVGNISKTLGELY